VFGIEVVSLESMLSWAAKRGTIELVKLDIEGAEFDTLRSFGRMAHLLLSVPQWFIEFHPAPQTHETLSSIFGMVREFKRLGFSTFSPNGVDWLFYQSRRNA
jgi:hypothetical protein